MNKRIKKKRKLLDLVAELKRANDLQQEIIEDYGNQLAQVKREQTDLSAIVERNAQASNILFDQLNAENKALRAELAELKQSLKPKKSWFGRK